MVIGIETLATVHTDTVDTLTKISFYTLTNLASVGNLQSLKKCIYLFIYVSIYPNDIVMSLRMHWSHASLVSC